MMAGMLVVLVIMVVMVVVEVMSRSWMLLRWWR
jgi:hypothetical protein